MSYKKLFLALLDYNCNGQLVRKEKTSVTNYECEAYCPKGGLCPYSAICTYIYSVIMKDIPYKDIEKFFNAIAYCYDRRINTDVSRALVALEAILDEYHLIPALGTLNNMENSKNATTETISSTYSTNSQKENSMKSLRDYSYKQKITQHELVIHNLKKRVFFRARIAAKTDQFFGKMDLFHVPFSQRYKLRNERFSLTGQPALYLGNSIPDLLEEMGICMNNEPLMERVRIASFELNESMFIYDLRCNYYDALQKQEKRLFTRELFFRNLLALICSFQKRRELSDAAFKEEYVIPQMLTQVLKRRGYQGICYYSTKPFLGYAYPEKDTLRTGQELLYRENLVIFTNEDSLKQESHDTTLFNSMEISLPISIRNTRKQTEDDMERVLKTIQNTSLDIKGIDSMPITREKAESIVKFYRDILKPLRYEGKEYKNTVIGLIHIQLLIGCLNRLLVDSESSLKAEIILQKETNQKPLKGSSVTKCTINGQTLETIGYKQAHCKGDVHLSQVYFITT